MAERRRSRSLLAVLTLIALVLITMDYRQDDDGTLTTLRRGALVVFAPVQDGFSQVVSPIGGFFSGVAEYIALRDRNRALEAEVEELEAQMPSVADIQRENEELRALLSMRDRYELDTVAASVIGWPPGERSNTIVIDGGGDEGIQSGMAVVGARGLIGKVTVTTPRYAWVELLTSPTARYAVRDADTGRTGLLRGRGADPFQMELLDPEAVAAEGAEVVTSTFQGSTIPDGLPVGEVVEPGSADSGTSPRYHLVAPFVDFRRLSVVQVVVDAPEPPEAYEPDEILVPPERERPPSGNDDEGEEDHDGGDDEEDEGDEGDEGAEGDEGDADDDGGTARGQSRRAAARE